MEKFDRKIKILMVDDDEHICQLLALYLQRDGFDAEFCHDGDTALNKLSVNTYDAVILDVMMPGPDGFEVLSELRKFSNVPVIMLSARGEPTDRISGLNRGADDYITKPFEPQELIARIRAVLRRFKQTEEDKKIVTLFNLTVNLNDFTVMLNGEKVEMPPKEIELLYMLTKTPMHVFTRDELLKYIWGQSYSGDSRTVDVHIKRVREKLGDNPHWRLTTVWGVGYKIEVF
ncbi:MAG: response regulator transcription factor [Clostridiales bacterium]|nr:response regulator transcription factor [Clostridiales bacterium]